MSVEPGQPHNKAVVLAYQSGGQINTGALPADRRWRWRNLFVDDIDQAALTEAATARETADNYDASHLFNSPTSFTSPTRPGARIAVT